MLAYSGHFRLLLGNNNAVVPGLDDDFLLDDFQLGVELGGGEYDPTGLENTWFCPRGLDNRLDTRTKTKTC